LRTSKLITKPDRKTVGSEGGFNIIDGDSRRNNIHIHVSRRGSHLAEVEIAVSDIETEVVC